MNPYSLRNSNGEPLSTVVENAHGVLQVNFAHGLGDCVYFAHQLPLYQRRGWEIVVSCSPEKEFLFRAAGVPVSASPDAGLAVAWFEGEEPSEELRFDNYWRWSKLARNLSLEPMPDIGHPAALWNEYCAISLDARPYLAGHANEALGMYVNRLTPPLILLHSQGATDGERKNIPPGLLRLVCRELLARSEGTILLLDSEADVPPVPHWRVRHVQRDFGRLSIHQLLFLLDRADLAIGIDSGPLHLARLTNTPSIGVWMNNASPTTWSLPRAMQVNVVVGRKCRHWRKQARLPFNILECDDPDSLPGVLGRAATRMLAGSRYLPTQDLGRDILLQQFVRDWQGGGETSSGGFNDREEGFDRLLRTAARRFERPAMVETGCIRREEDFQGAGFSTLLLGMFAASRKGVLLSIDHDREHCDFARQTVACLGEAVEVIESDSVEWLAANQERIDVLYLDSRDTDLPGCAEHGLREVQAAYSRLHDRSVLALDDTGYENGVFVGSGAFSVPWLLDRGWHILHSGHQTILSRNNI
jgi:hypothetical protein